MSYISQIRSFLHRILRKTPTASDYHRPILSEEDGNSLLLSHLESNRPFIASRLGGGELVCLRHFMGGRKHGQAYPEATVTLMKISTGGFFPLTDEGLDGFCKVYLDAVRQADAMCIWFIPGENRVIREHCPSATLLPLRTLEPYYYEVPWSKALQGKKVLVVHPFAESIREQYENKRTLLFENPDILPEFQLRTLKAVHSFPGQPNNFATWFDALDSMKLAMDSIDYEVCIIGAGPFGLPLAAHAKRSGKQVVHMGGASQILFGIKGKRWDDHEVISKLYNDAWVRPSNNETPPEYKSVEDGCYW